MLKQIKRTVLVILLVCLCAACGGPVATPPPPQPPALGQYPIDPVFLEVYAGLGGEAVLGPAISVSRHEGSVTRQSFVGGELVFDPYAPEEATFILAPIAKDYGIQDPPVPPPALPELPYENGHVIYPDFMPAIKAMGGLRWVGNPLTEARYNLIFRRYEQYFENVGFYRLEGSPDVHLLAYGAWGCQDRCSSVGVSQENVVPIQGHFDPTFQPFVVQNGTNFTGYPLMDAYTATDGNYDLVTEYLVMSAEQRSDPNSVALRPLPTLLDIVPESPLPYSGDSNMYFYATNGDLGYEIPTYFWDYLEKHGGIAISGPPITHYELLQAQMYHQCFANLCLVYDLTMYPEARIWPEPLGHAYLVKFPTPNQPPIPTSTAPQPEVTQAPPAATPLTEPAVTGVPQTQPTQAPSTQPAMREIALHVWAQYASIDLQKQQGQQIGIWVTENGRPLENSVPVLVLNLPDGSTQTYIMPPTSPNGQSNLLLPELKAENGAVFPYRVCIQATDGLRLCGASFFVIWNNP